MTTGRLHSICRHTVHWLVLFPWTWCLALAAETGPKTAPSPPADANVSRMKDIHDIKPALDIGFDLQWLYWALTIVVLLMLAALAWRLWRKRKRKTDSQSAATPIPADAEAYRMLDDLAAQGDLDPKRFYFSLSAILRRYIERCYGIPASEMTTEELLPAVDRLGLSTELSPPLKDFCRGADPIKFAGVSATRERMARDLAFARDFVRQTTQTATIAAESEVEENPPPASQITGTATMAAGQGHRITHRTNQRFDE